MQISTSRVEQDGCISGGAYGVQGATDLTRTNARILEQNLIIKYGLGNNGGLLLNKINSIAPKNWSIFGINP